MPIFEAGSLNTTALVVPDTYIQILPPQLALLNGVPTDKLGIVGTAKWGPVGVPMPISSYADMVRHFGSLSTRTYDLGTAVALAVQQGAQNIAGVRVTDGTDAAATATVQTSGGTATAKWTGTGGNDITMTIATGSKASSWKIIVAQKGSGRAPEVFDNITGSANALWVAIGAAINSGIAGQRGPSDLITFSAGASTTAPSAATIALTGGADGAGVAASDLIGSDTVPRKGMYSLRGAGCSIGVLADVTDDSVWATQVSFGLAEGIYFMLGNVAGQSVASCVTTKASAGIDTRAAKVCLGDHVYWYDPVTAITRLVNPMAIFAGRLANLSPHLSGLNKQVYGVVATQRSRSGAPYSYAELAELARAGIDVITNPIPAGSVFGIRMGQNSSSSPTENGDNATRMTNYLATTLNAGMGKFVGEPTSDQSLRQTQSTLDAFLQSLFDQGMIEDWRVVCGPTNNPPNRRALGYRQADVQVRYLSITRFLVVNLEGGQATTIVRGAA